LPSFSLEACLKTTGVRFLFFYFLKNIIFNLFFFQAQIELITDLDLYEFIEKSKRGGLSQVSKRLCQTSEGEQFLHENGIKCPTRTISEDLHSNILYLDANNLYGECLQEVQPHHSYNWLTNENCESMSKFFQMGRREFEQGKEQTQWNVFFDDEFDNPLIEKTGRIDKNGDPIEGSEEEMFFFLEIDIHYPDELHEDHNDFPLAPALYEITEADVSEKSKQLIKIDKKGSQQLFKSQKLCTMFTKKIGYVTTLENALMFMRRGLDIR
jgi:hypothetical protein